MYFSLKKNLRNKAEYKEFKMEMGPFWAANTQELEHVQVWYLGFPVCYSNNLMPFFKIYMLIQLTGVPKKKQTHLGPDVIYFCFCLVCFCLESEKWLWKVIPLSCVSSGACRSWSHICFPFTDTSISFFLWALCQRGAWRGPVLLMLQWAECQLNSSSFWCERLRDLGRCLNPRSSLVLPFKSSPPKWSDTCLERSARVEGIRTLFKRVTFLMKVAL